jgi:hypothetical protein
VRREHHRFAARAGFFDEREHRRPHARVEVGRRLVEDVERRVSGERCRQRQLLLHAGGHVAHLAAEVEFQPFGKCLRSAQVAAGADFGKKPQSVAAPHVRKHSRFGWQVGDISPHGYRLPLAIEASNAGPASRRPQIAKQ